jgi:hypothetical protein
LSELTIDLVWIAEDGGKSFGNSAVSELQTLDGIVVVADAIDNLAAPTASH